MKLQQPQQIQVQHSNYWFVLGRQATLAAAELSAVFELKNDLTIIQNTAMINTYLDPKEIINGLGGTIKICKEINDGISKKEIDQLLLSELVNIEGKIHFGISYHGHKMSVEQIKQLALKTKKDLKKMNRSVRFIPNKELVLSSATVKNNNLHKRGVEFVIIEKEDNNYIICKTVAIQPFEKFSSRDFGRPGRDDYSGMLPPKLAIILLNLAKAKKNNTLLDPFCGSGTILSEAMLLGYDNLIGSDNSQKAIDDSRDNFEWTSKTYNIKTKIKLIHCDIEEISKKIADGIDTIITEPYLGKPLRGNEKEEILTTQVKNLKLLYITAFTEFNKIMKNNGSVIFIIPRFKYKDDWITIDCTKEIQNIGFSVIPITKKESCLLYFRPNQKLGREIWHFKKDR